MIDCWFEVVEFVTKSSVENRDMPELHPVARPLTINRATPWPRLRLCRREISTRMLLTRILEPERGN